MASNFGKKRRAEFQHSGIFQNNREETAVSSTDSDEAPPFLVPSVRIAADPEFVTPSKIENNSEGVPDSSYKDEWWLTPITSEAPQLQRADIDLHDNIFDDSEFEEPVYPDLSHIFDMPLPPIPSPILNHDPSVSAFVIYSPEPKPYVDSTVRVTENGHVVPITRSICILPINGTTNTRPVISLPSDEPSTSNT